MKKIICLTIAALSIVAACGERSMADESDYVVRYVCSVANDTYIRDYPTFKPVAKLNRGECMDVIPDAVKGSPVKSVFYRGQSYYMVSGASGNVRVISTRYTELR